MRRGNGISTSWLDAPFAVHVPHLARESGITDGRDDESAQAEASIGLGVAVAAQGDQLIEVEVRVPWVRLVTWCTSRRGVIRTLHA